MTTILIVDDHADGADALAVLLRMHGYAAEVAGDADVAMLRVRVGGIDALVLDEYLPGEDGLSLLRRIRERQALRHLPVLFWTGASAEKFDDLQHELLSLQPATAVRKPMEAERLLLLLGAMLEQARTNMANE